MPMAPLCLPRVRKMNSPGVVWLLCMAHAPVQPVAPLAVPALLAAPVPIAPPAAHVQPVLAGHMMQKQNA